MIGPNGSGKSNLFDAISFVLGVRSAQLRSTQLKDLIYRGGRKGKGKELEADANGEMMDVDESEEEDVEEGPSAKKAWVMAVYEDADEKEWRYQRMCVASTLSSLMMRDGEHSITAAGASEYRINNRLVTFAAYNNSLETHNILVKARNFLVFQVRSLVSAFIVPSGRPAHRAMSRWSHSKTPRSSHVSSNRSAGVSSPASVMKVLA